jgi:hypothetical protein
MIEAFAVAAVWNHEDCTYCSATEFEDFVVVRLAIIKPSIRLVLANYDSHT